MAVLFTAGTRRGYPDLRASMEFLVGAAAFQPPARSAGGATGKSPFRSTTPGAVAPRLAVAARLKVGLRCHGRPAGQRVSDHPLAGTRSDGRTGAATRIAPSAARAPPAFVLVIAEWLRSLSLAAPRMNGRLIAIGDIHGCHREFSELLHRLDLSAEAGDRHGLRARRAPDGIRAARKAFHSGQSAPTLLAVNI